MEEVIEGDEVAAVKLNPRRCNGHCGKMFVPLSKFNCICPKCTSQNEGVCDRAYRVSRKYPRE